MSLLSGIRYIPKSEREGSASEGESDGSSGSSRPKKSKKKKSSKHHDKINRQDKKHKKEKGKVRKRKYSDYKTSRREKVKPPEHNYDHAEEINYMNELVENEAMKTKSASEFELFNVYDNNNCRSSMKDYCKMALDDIHRELSDEEDADATLENDTIVSRGETSCMATMPNTTASPKQPVDLNQNMAAMLREKLLKGENLSTSAITESNENNNYNNDVDLMSFMTVGELKWMKSYKLKQASQDSSKSSFSSRSAIDENRASLQDLVAMEKVGGGVTGSAGDIDKIISENIVKRGAGYRGFELGFGSGVGSQRGFGSDKAGMDEEEGIGVRPWLGVESESHDEDNEKNKKSKESSKYSGDQQKKKKKVDVLNGVDMTMFYQKEDKMTEKQIYDSILKKAIAKQKSHSQIVLNCTRCVSGRYFRNDLVLSTGSYFQLRLKSRSRSLVPGWHSELVPLHHSSTVLLAEKESDGESVVHVKGAESSVLKELSRFKNCLQAMFERLGKGVVFTEVGTCFGKKHHTVVDVIPIQRGMEGEVCMSFKQAFSDSGDAYSTHKKRIIDINNVSKPFHTCLPPHFPYIVVEWGQTFTAKKAAGHEEQLGQVGLVYVLDAAISINDGELEKENSSEFGTNFCLDVLAGILEIDQLERKLMRQRGEAIEAKSADLDDVQQFQKEWSVYDWAAYSV